MNIYTVWLNGLIFPMVSREGEEKRREKLGHRYLAPFFLLTTRHKAEKEKEQTLESREDFSSVTKTRKHLESTSKLKKQQQPSLVSLH